VNGSQFRHFRGEQKRALSPLDNRRKHGGVLARSFIILSSTVQWVI
jgi:hypothetical protein